MFVENQSIKEQDTYEFSSFNINRMPIHSKLGTGKKLLHTLAYITKLLIRVHATLMGILLTGVQNARETGDCGYSVTVLRPNNIKNESFTLLTY